MLLTRNAESNSNSMKMYIVMCSLVVNTQVSSSYEFVCVMWLMSIRYAYQHHASYEAGSDM